MDEDDDIKPDVEDIVSYGTALWSLDGRNVVSAAPEGTVTKVFKNGSISVKSHRTGKIVFLNPLEFTVLRKAL